MREITISSWCDACLERDQRTPGNGVIVAFGGKQQTLDLCEADEKALVAPLRDLASRRGMDATKDRPRPLGAVQAAPVETRQGRRPASGWTMQCLCGRDYASTSGLLRHGVEVHGVKAKSLAELFGRVCPVCGTTHTFLGSHGNSHHGGELPEFPNLNTISATPMLFSLALQLGDPFKVVATRRHALGITV